MIYDPLKIKTLREAKGWNLSELARASALSVPSVWSLEHGETKMPKHSTMIKVARALGVPVSAISASKVSVSETEALQERLTAIFDSLDTAHRVALIAAADALLKAQPKK